MTVKNMILSLLFIVVSIVKYEVIALETATEQLDPPRDIMPIHYIMRHPNQHSAASEASSTKRPALPRNIMPIHYIIRRPIRHPTTSEAPTTKKPALPRNLIPIHYIEGRPNRRSAVPIKQDNRHQNRPDKRYASNCNTTRTFGKNYESRVGAQKLLDDRRRRKCFSLLPIAVQPVAQTNTVDRQEREAKPFVDRHTSNRPKRDAIFYDDHHKRFRRAVFDDKGFSEFTPHSNTRGMLYGTKSFGPNSHGGWQNTAKIEHDFWKSRDGNHRITGYMRHDRIDGGRFNGFKDNRAGIGYIGRFRRSTSDDERFADEDFLTENKSKSFRTITPFYTSGILQNGRLYRDYDLPL